MHRTSAAILIFLGACVVPEDPPAADTSIDALVAEPFGLMDMTPTTLVHPHEPCVEGRPRWVEVSGTDHEITCASPSAREEVLWHEWSVPTLGISTDSPHDLVGGALAIEDFTGNGHLDVIVAGHEQIMLLEGDGSGLSRRENALFPHASLVFDITSLTAFDADGDGDLDLLVSVWGEGPQLWRNDGEGRFVDATTRAGMPTHGTRYLQAGAGDLDHDGDLDLFVSGYGITPHENGNDFVGDEHLLLANDGNGVFTDISDRLSEDVHSGYAFTGVFQDADDDGRQDLLIMHDFGQHMPSKVLWNTSAGLVEDDGDAGLDYAFSSMGLAVADLNFDGIPDFAHTSASAHPLYLSSEGVWLDYAEYVGFEPDMSWPAIQKFGWGIVFTDLDNDALHDVVIGFGYWEEYGGAPTSTDAVWKQTAPEVFDKQSAAWQLDQDGITRAVLAADLNEDGWPDIIKRYLDGSTSVQVSQCGDAHWLSLRLRDDSPNTQAVGAKVEVVVGEVTYTDWVQAGGTSLFASAPYELHFGLADATAIDEVRITWPDGELTTLPDIPTNRRLVAHRRTGERADLASLGAAGADCALSLPTSGLP